MVKKIYGKKKYSANILNKKRAPERAL